MSPAAAMTPTALIPRSREAAPRRMVPAGSGASFETRPSAAPQDEGCGFKRPVSPAVLFIGLLLTTTPSTAQEIKPGSAFLSPQMRQQQEDEARNPGWLWVEQGQELFSRREGAEPACLSCHADPRQSLRGAAARYPQVDAASGKLINLEGRIEQCRVERQKQPAFGYESQDLLGLTAYVASLSTGAPLAVSAEGAAKPYYEAGKTFYERRQGQLNLACTQCHDGLVGQKLRGDTISHGVGTGYPAYRLEWNGLGSLHRRLRACSLGVRATQFDYGSDEYLALELYLAVRAKGLPIEAPGLRR
jgi:L-cysteine S-thiosulfotransferase